ncbi:MAG: TIGR02281 family clan AA aspartic protease [Desulfatibacillum sp.]|nr:TIGR02281 family clan AA aspartic protease [Desulfatibacillum sp.]
MSPAHRDRPDKKNENPWTQYTESASQQDGESPKGWKHTVLGCLPAVFVMAVLLALIVYFGRARGLFAGQDGKYDLGYAIAMVLLVGALVQGLPRQGYMRAGKQILLWIGVLFVFILAYAYRGELGDVRDRMMAVLVPDRGMAVAEGVRSFEIADDGHFYIQARVNGLPVLFLADTGATNVVLTRYDAQRIGMDTENLDYDGRASTANGMVRVARISLNTLEVGDYTLDNFPASVNDSELDTSLLGMSFFSRLESYGVEGKTLTITWRTD